MVSGSDMRGLLVFTNAGVPYELWRIVCELSVYIILANQNVKN